jgi:hypothetical protein
MHTTRGLIVALGAACAVGTPTRADVVYLSQERLVEAATSADGNSQVLAATGFDPFVETLRLFTTFPTEGGGTAPNGAEAGIDCQLDPNAIRIVGSLLGSGGLGVVGGSPVLQFGEAAADISTDFRVDVATPYTLRASARPSTRPGDRFKIKLKDETRNIVVFLLDDTMPPQEVAISGVLSPGNWSLDYEAELTVDGPEMLRNFYFNMNIGCYANCDGSTTAPVLNVNDFVCFQAMFAQGDPRANCDDSTVAPILNVSDFICFQQKFAAGCSAP